MDRGVRRLLAGMVATAEQDTRRLTYVAAVSLAIFTTLQAAAAKVKFESSRG